MAKVTEINPKIITLEFRQERGDPDYGSCLWARFYLDTENYTMTIESDCGNYGYAWAPTPTSESFLHLMARVDADYLLDKISSETVIDEKATLHNVAENIWGYRHLSLCTANRPCMDDVRNAVCCSDVPSEVVTALRESFQYSFMEDAIDTYEMYELVEMTHPSNAKKITEVFEQFIAPKCFELNRETKYTSKECSVIEQAERLVSDYPGEVWPWFISKDEMLYHLRNNGKYTDALVKAFLECNNMYDALTSAFGKNPNAQD